MKSKDLLSITLVAVGTATLTVAGFMANPLEAGNGANPMTLPNAHPKLVADGVELSLTPAAGRVFQAGDQPAFELHAVNTLDRPTTLNVRVALNSTDSGASISRVVAMPTVMWHEERLLTLLPHESQTTKLTVGPKLPANRMVSVILTALTTNQPPNAPVPGMMALNFSTETALTVQRVITDGFSPATPERGLAPESNWPAGR
jgi:hypothetical protein